MRMCVLWARGGGDAVSLAWSLRRAAPRLLLDDADPAVIFKTDLCTFMHLTPFSTSYFPIKYYVFLRLIGACSQVRREAGSALYRLCSGGEVAVLAPLLQLLLEHLPRAADMRPHHGHHHQHHHEVILR